MKKGHTSHDGSPSNLLRNVKLKVYDPDFCEHVLPIYKKNWSNQICAGELAGGKDTCQGDSGGLQKILHHYFF